MLVPYAMMALMMLATAAVAALPAFLGAGATMPQRDAADARVVSQVRAGTGRLIADPSDVGGWPELAQRTPYPDEDGDGYTDLEDFLNSLVPPAGARAPSASRQE